MTFRHLNKHVIDPGCMIHQYARQSPTNKAQWRCYCQGHKRKKNDWLYSIRLLADYLPFNTWNSPYFRSNQPIVIPLQLKRSCTRQLLWLVQVRWTQRALHENIATSRATSRKTVGFRKEGIIFFFPNKYPYLL